MCPLFYFEGLAKLGTSWITALYPTSPKEIFLEKNRCRRLRSILMMRGAPCHERQQLCAKSLLWAGLLVAGLGSEPYPDWGRRYIPGQKHIQIPLSLHQHHNYYLSYDFSYWPIATDSPELETPYLIRQWQYLDKLARLTVIWNRETAMLSNNIPWKMARLD